MYCNSPMQSRLNILTKYCVYYRKIFQAFVLEPIAKEYDNNAYTLYLYKDISYQIQIIFVQGSIYI